MQRDPAPPRRAAVDAGAPPVAAAAPTVAKGAGAPGCWAVVAGGGTIGHLVPGVATALELVARGCPPAAIHFVGSERGVEATRVPDAGFELTLLPGRGIKRRPSLDNVGAVVGLGRAAVRAVALLRRRRPAVVLATGGYASVPCALGAALLRIPLVVAEQNAVPGLANRVGARFARAAATSLPGTDLPRAVLTGNPVRPEVLAVDLQRDRADAREALGVAPGRFLVAVFGGSLGARRLNEATLEARARWRDRPDLAVHHVVGDRDWDRFADRTGPVADERLQYRAVAFEAAMPSVLAAADLVVCRAGASSVAELCAVGVPAVLVPLPGAPGDHQTANARALVEGGAAELVPDDELDGERLVEVVGRLAPRPALLSDMRAASAALGRRDAAARVADLVEEAASRPRPSGVAVTGAAPVGTTTPAAGPAAPDPQERTP